MAEVLCLSCHGRRAWNGRPVPSDDMWQWRHERVRPEPDESETRCDRCGRAIVVSADVAALHGVRNALRAAGIRSAVMEQTGGMCAAVLVPTAGGVRVQVYADVEVAGGFVIARAEGNDSEEAVVTTVRGTAAAVAAVRRALA
jgi:hypothetical protein